MSEARNGPPPPEPQPAEKKGNRFAKLFSRRSRTDAPVRKDQEYFLVADYGVATEKKPSHSVNEDVSIAVGKK
jgi:hypothetical protein